MDYNPPGSSIHGMFQARILDSYYLLWNSLLAQMVNDLPAMQETWVRFLGWEDPLEEGMATHSSVLAWRISMDRGAWWATFHEIAKSQTQLSTTQKHLAYFWNSHQAAAKILKTSS